MDMMIRQLGEKAKCLEGKVTRSTNCKRTPSEVALAIVQERIRWIGDRSNAIEKYRAAEDSIRDAEVVLFHELKGIPTHATLFGMKLNLRWDHPNAYDRLEHTGALTYSERAAQKGMPSDANHPRLYHKCYKPSQDARKHLGQ